MDQAYFDSLADGLKNGSTPYVNAAGLVPKIIEERHVCLHLPIDELHRNHVGIAYAGSEFVLAEISGGLLFQATYDPEKWVPILKSVDIKFLKPGTKELIVDLTLTQDEAAEKIAEAQERGRGNYYLSVPVKDIDGEHVAQFEFNYYALPARK